jgi:hypothetical protein
MQQPLPTEGCPASMSHEVNHADKNIHSDNKAPDRFL